MTRDVDEHQAIEDLYGEMAISRGERRRAHRAADQRACVFCQIVAGTAPATVLASTPTVQVIAPLNPVVDGHVLVIPRRHVADAGENPGLTGAVMEAAASWAGSRGDAFNLITSAGADATQTVFHLHIHYVPRREGDGLPLPWTPQHTEET